ncbi:MAG: hypothetical protein QM642_08265, partial [Edaphocola sp.]
MFYRLSERKGKAFYDGYVAFYSLFGKNPMKYAMPRSFVMLQASKKASPFASFFPCKWGCPW